MDTLLCVLMIYVLFVRPVVAELATKEIDQKRGRFSSDQKTRLSENFSALDVLSLCCFVRRFNHVNRHRSIMPYITRTKLKI